MGVVDCADHVLWNIEKVVSKLRKQENEPASKLWIKAPNQGRLWGESSIVC